MARPRKDGMDYFPHDVNATGDKKIEALRILYGNDGYAFYFILLEMIYQEPNFELDVSDAETIQILIKKTEVSQEKFNSMLETAIKRECFDRERYENDRILTSNGIKKRASVVVDKREKMRKSYEESKSGAEKSVSDAETPTETPEETPQSKSKRKVKEYGAHVRLTEEEHAKLVEEWGADEVARFVDDANYYFEQQPAKRKKYSNHNLMLRRWKKMDLDKGIKRRVQKSKDNVMTMDEWKALEQQKKEAAMQRAVEI